MREKSVRPSMPKARRMRLWERDNGVCYLCDTKVQVGEAWEIEHRVPWALSFDDSDENLHVAHKDGECHASKTKADVKRIAKAKAQAGETGQKARRDRRGHSLIKSNPKWPKGRKLESRPFSRKRNDDKANPPGS